MDNLDQQYQALKELGDCYATLGEHQPARECYLKAAAMAPELAGPHVGLGVIELQLGRLEEAQHAFDLARCLDPTCAQAYGGLAMIRQQTGRHPTALEMYLKCLELDSDNLLALLGLFQTSCKMGTFAKIIHYLEVYLARHPHDASVLFCLATLYAREGLLERAKGLLREVLDLEPQKTEAADLLAEVQRNLAQCVTT